MPQSIARSWLWREPPRTSEERLDVWLVESAARGQTCVRDSGTCDEMMTHCVDAAAIYPVEIGWADRGVVQTVEHANWPYREDRTMAQVDLEITYSLRLTSAEFRLVTLALAGKISSKEDVREALSLNERLCELRARLTAQLSEITAGARAKASELRATVLGADA